MISTWVFFVLNFLFLYVSCLKWNDERASENLIVLPLTRNEESTKEWGSFPTYLRYTHKYIMPNCTRRHHTQFPMLTWLELCDDFFSFRWFSMSLTQGQWRYTLGDAFFLPGEEGDPGGEVQAVLGDWNLEREWNALLGFLDVSTCTSSTLLHDLDQVTFLKNSFLLSHISYARSNSSLNSTNRTFSYLRGRLPFESLCTENFYALLVSLGCRGRSGLAQLFMSSRWLSSLPYRRLSLYVFRDIPHQLVLKVVISAVWDAPFLFNSHFPTLTHTTSPLDVLTHYLGLSHELLNPIPCSVISHSQINFFIPLLNSSTLSGNTSYEKVLVPSYFSDDNDKEKNNSNENEDERKESRHKLVFSNRPTFFLRTVQCNTFVIKIKGISDRLEARYVIRCTNFKSIPSVVRYYGILPCTLQPLLHTLQVQNLTSRDQLIYGYDVLKKFNMHWIFSKTAEGIIQFDLNFLILPHESISLEFTFWKKFLRSNYFAFGPERGLLLPGGFYYEKIETKELNEIKRLGESILSDISCVRSSSNQDKHDFWIRRTTSSHFLMFPFPEIGMTLNTIALSTLAVFSFLDRIGRHIFQRYPLRVSPISRLKFLLPLLGRFGAIHQMFCLRLQSMIYFHKFSSLFSINFLKRRVKRS